MDVELPDEVRQVCASFTEAVNQSAEGLLHGLYLRGSLAWGEFFPGSDIDFTAVLSRRPADDDLRALEAAHTQIWFEHPDHFFDGHHLVVDDLQRDPLECPPVPVAHEGSFTAQGDLDVNPVTWCELAERGIRVAGRDPRRLGIHSDAEELWHFTQRNLETYWEQRARELKVAWMVVGRRDDAVVWCTLGAARLHHLLATGEMTSKSGAGHYILEHLDERWNQLATDALRARERPGGRSVYRSLAQRGKDVRDFLAWCVADGANLEPPHFEP